MAQPSISSYYRSTRKRAGEDEALAAKRRKTASQEVHSLCPFIQPEVSLPLECVQGKTLSRRASRHLPCVLPSHAA